MIFGLLGGVLAAIGVDLGSFLGRPERILGAIWATLAAFWATLGASGPIWASSWSSLAPQDVPKRAQDAPRGFKRHPKRDQKWSQEENIPRKTAMANNGFQMKAYIAGNRRKNDARGNLCCGGE